VVIPFFGIKGIDWIITALNLVKLMKTFLSEIRAAVLVTLVMAVVLCGLYPLVVFGIGQALFHDKANGSLIRDAKGTILDHA